MGILKKIALAMSISILCSTLFSSCLNDNEPETLYPTLGTVQQEEQLIIDSDSYGRLIPTNPNKFTAADLDEDGQRVMISVLASEIEAPVSEGKIRKVEIIELYKVTTKDADRTGKEEEEVQEEFGNDPVQVTRATISKEHLNVQYRLKGTDRDTPHRISLVLKTDCQPDENGLLPVELRHDAQKDNQLHDFWSVTSFRLSSIPEYQEGAAKGFKIIYNSGADAKAEWVVKK